MNWTVTVSAVHAGPRERRLKRGVAFRLVKRVSAEPSIVLAKAVAVSGKLTALSVNTNAPVSSINADRERREYFEEAYARRASSIRVVSEK
jgi:hypothetical protein